MWSLRRNCELFHTPYSLTSLILRRPDSLDGMQSVGRHGCERVSARGTQTRVHVHQHDGAHTFSVHTRAADDGNQIVGRAGEFCTTEANALCRSCIYTNINTYFIIDNKEKYIL